MSQQTTLQSLPLSTERTLIRQASIDDAAFFLELMTSEGWLKNIGDRGIYTLADAEAHVQNNILKSYQDNGFGMYVICGPQGDAIGSAGFIDRPTLEHVDIGYAFLPHAFGQGYAIEACRCVYQYGVEQLEIKPVVAITASDNERSGNLLLKLGFKRLADICLPDSGESVHYYVDQQHPEYPRH
ncbi:GNAT family N-acetyltransferase [Pseudoteredinibacter isoporae]|uniref:GNAT family N-acetyltransferase n=1 Tax=Pseudoteredinibacter isoporae TaxID=570281 RepID=UPI00310819EE